MVFIFLIGESIFVEDGKIKRVSDSESEMISECRYSTGSTNILKVELVINNVLVCR